MAAKKTNVAKELLELERQYQKGGLDEKQALRWQELVGEIFGEQNSAHNRRSFRIASEVSCKVKIRQGAFDCSLLEVSRIGLSISGVVFNYITHEDTVQLASTRLDNEERPLDLLCRIVRFDNGRKPAVAGLVIAENNSDEVRGRYFDRLYYPLYLRFLNRLAKEA
jgi:hypothetical protein